MAKYSITKYYLCRIVVLDSITSISNFQWQSNGFKVPVKSNKFSAIVENNVQFNDDVNYFQLQQEYYSRLNSSLRSAEESLEIFIKKQRKTILLYHLIHLVQEINLIFMLSKMTSVI